MDRSERHSRRAVLTKRELYQWGHRDGLAGYSPCYAELNACTLAYRAGQERGLRDRAAQLRSPTVRLLVPEHSGANLRC